MFSLRTPPFHQLFGGVLHVGWCVAPHCPPPCDPLALLSLPLPPAAAHGPSFVPQHGASSAPPQRLCMA